MAKVVRPRFVTLGRGPVGAAGAGEGSTEEAGSDMVLVTMGGLKQNRNVFASVNCALIASH